MLEPRGIAMGGIDAVEWLEKLPDKIPDELKDIEFCDQYNRVLNRVRYEVSRSVPVAPKVTKAIYKKYHDFYSCGECGFDLRTDIYDHCPKCGRAIKWSAVFPGRYP